MTIRDLMNRLGIGRAGASKLMREPDFPAVRIGKKFFVDADRFEEWYDQSLAQKSVNRLAPARLVREKVNVTKLRERRFWKEG